MKRAEITKPRVGGRAKYIGQACIEYGTIIDVSKDGKTITVEWDVPNPDTDETIFEYELHPASAVRPV